MNRMNVYLFWWHDAFRTILQLFFLFQVTYASITQIIVTLVAAVQLKTVIVWVRIVGERLIQERLQLLSVIAAIAVRVIDMAATTFLAFSIGRFIQLNRKNKQIVCINWILNCGSCNHLTEHLVFFFCWANSSSTSGG